MFIKLLKIVFAKSLYLNHLIMKSFSYASNLLSSQEIFGTGELRELKLLKKRLYLNIYDNIHPIINIMKY